MITEISSIADVATLLEQTALGGFIYRGQKEYSWALEATIQRKGNEAILKNEMQIYGQFRQALLYRHLPIRETIPPAAGQWLALMQHYGLPTRLLDWTEDLTVGLYYACENSNNIDGALYVLNPFHLCLAAQHFMHSIQSDIKGPETIPFFNFPEARFEHFCSGNEVPRVVPIKPLAPNEREAIQKGVFTVSNNMVLSQDEIIEPTANFVKIRIKQPVKNDVLQFLKSHQGLCHEYLMSPIGAIARGIKEKYC